MNQEPTHVESDGSAAYIWVWICLLALTAVEIVFAYVHLLPVSGMLLLLMALSIVKAGLIMAYFMHLRFERPSLVVSLIPGAVLVITLLLVFFLDSFRLFELRVR